MQTAAGGRGDGTEDATPQSAHAGGDGTPSGGVRGHRRSAVPLNARPGCLVAAGAGSLAHNEVRSEVRNNGAVEIATKLGVRPAAAATRGAVAAVIETHHPVSRSREGGISLRRMAILDGLADDSPVIVARTTPGSAHRRVSVRLLPSCTCCCCILGQHSIL